MMSRRTTGALLLVVSTILYMTRYLTAAILGSSTQGWSADLFAAMLQHVGYDLTTWSLVALIAALVYLIGAEVETFLKPGLEK